MKESSKRMPATDIFFMSVTANMGVDSTSVMGDKAIMSAASREYSLVKKDLIKYFSFIYTVLETITVFNKDWEKQATVSAAFLAVETMVMSLSSGDKEKSTDIESILDWTNLQYKTGAYRRNKKGYKWRIALMLHLLDEINLRTKTRAAKS
jgi:hypothetical protein